MTPHSDGAHRSCSLRNLHVSGIKLGDKLVEAWWLIMTWNHHVHLFAGLAFHCCFLWTGSGLCADQKQPQPSSRVTEEKSLQYLQSKTFSKRQGCSPPQRCQWEHHRQICLTKAPFRKKKHYQHVKFSVLQSLRYSPNFPWDWDFRSLKENWVIVL